MPETPSLFGDPVAVAGPHRDIIPDVRATAARGDPATSRAAADRMNASGKVGRDAAIVLRVLRDNPGYTAVELFNSQGENCLTRHDFSRRLPELRDAGLAENGPARKCQYAGTLQLTWHATEAAP
jgi:hypothetical protein